MLSKNSAKEVAEKEVNRRIVSKEKANAYFQLWIRETMSVGGFSEEVIEFWDEVSKQADKL
jgi:hypothetical protein